VLDRMAARQRAGRPYFLFANLYDVDAPYQPSQTGIFRPWRTLDDCLENVTMPFVLPCLGSHRYLRSGFRLSARSRRALLARYHRAVELMDAKLGTFCSQARAGGLLDDTLLVVTSDHGEAFGDHGLYLHDASVYQTHLHVPLYVQHRGLQPATVDDVVSMRHLSEMLCAAANGPSFAGTILDPDFRGRHAIALAEHFHYPHAPKASPRYRRDLAAAIVGRDKVIVRRGEVERYDVQVDPGEESPQPGSVDDLMEAARRDGVARPIVASALSHLRRWQEVAQ